MGQPRSGVGKGPVPRRPILGRCRWWKPTP